MDLELVEFGLPPNCLFLLLQWSQLMNLGNATPDNVYEDRLKKMAVNQCCTIIYTVHFSS